MSALKPNLKIFLLVATMMTLIQCGQKNPYYEIEATELASSNRQDSLFFDLYLGMTSQEFYVRCWDLNEQGLLRQGAGNTSVLFEINDFRHPASMHFYPIFYDDRIIEMPLTFTYKAWSPWNRSLFSDSLKIEVLELMKEWYGQGFLEIPNPNKTGSSAFVKINDNRRISIYAPDDSKVSVDIVDLRLKKSIENQSE